MNDILTTLGLLIMASSGAIILVSIAGRNVKRIFTPCGYCGATKGYFSMGYFSPDRRDLKIDIYCRACKKFCYSKWFDNIKMIELKELAP